MAGLGVARTRQIPGLLPDFVPFCCGEDPCSHLEFNFTYASWDVDIIVGTAYSFTEVAGFIPE